MEVNYFRSLGSKEVPPTKRSTPAESTSTSTIQVEKGCGRAGSMKIVEEAAASRGTFNFPFAGLKPSQYRLTKGATMPILAAFRSYVTENQTTGDAEWRGGFDRVKQVWKQAGPSLVAETYQLTQDGIRTPDQVGKNRKHWGTLYMRLQVQLLQEKLYEEQSRPKRRAL